MVENVIDRGKKLKKSLRVKSEVFSRRTHGKPVAKEMSEPSTSSQPDFQRQKSET